MSFAFRSTHPTRTLASPLEPIIVDVPERAALEHVGMPPRDQIEAAALEAREDALAIVFPVRLELDRKRTQARVGQRLFGAGHNTVLDAVNVDLEMVRERRIEGGDEVVDC